MQPYSLGIHISEEDRSPALPLGVPSDAFQNRMWALRGPLVFPSTALPISEIVVNVFGLTQDNKVRGSLDMKWPAVMQ